MQSCSFFSAGVSGAQENVNSGAAPQWQTIADDLQKLDKRISDIQVQVQSLAHPVWEYKVVVPNIINTSGMEDQGIDGVNLSQLGKQGWELVNYTDQYGFIFKRRQVKK